MADRRRRRKRRPKQDPTPRQRVAVEDPESEFPATTRQTSRVNLAIVGAALVIAFFVYFSPDKISFNGGFGWDGLLYGYWVKQFHFIVLERKLDDYYVSRVLPAAVIHYAMRLCGIPLIDGNIIRAFGVLNASLIVLSSYIWLRIAEHLGLTEQGKALGFIGLFVNYAVIKWPSYYPVLNDTAGFFGGMLLVLLYLTGRRLLLAFVLPVAAFAWPTLLIEGAIFLALPRAGSANRQTTSHTPWNAVLAGIAGAVVTGAILVFLRADNRLASRVIYLSAVFCGLYVLAALHGLWRWDELFHPQFWIRRFSASIPLALLAFIAAKASTGMLTVARGYSAAQFFRQIAWTSTTQPAVFLVAHIVFFGPLLLIALLDWRGVSIAIRNLGVGFTAVTSLAVLLSLDSESRHIISFLPIFVIPTVCAIDRVPWRWSHVSIFGVVSLLFAKPWLIIGNDWGRYCLSQGPYMSARDYLLNLAVLVVLSGITYWMLRQSRLKLAVVA